MKVLNSLC
uniref:Uncharacterized protein n=1 Tax=Rhizophora mucronata TaxID=61149 RepID=A0A2P2ITW8_RHIMU